MLASFVQINLNSLDTFQKFINHNLKIALTSIVPANNIREAFWCFYSIQSLLLLCLMLQKLEGNYKIFREKNRTDCFIFIPGLEEAIVVFPRVKNVVP